MTPHSSAENHDANLLTLPSRETVMPEGFSIPADADGVEFRNLKLLGMGGMGIVYEAEDQALERKVALKMLRAPYRDDQVLVERFIKEARVTAKIDHPNIIAVHHLGCNKECGAYFSMRRIKGRTLQNVLKKLRQGDSDTLRQYTIRRMLNIFVAACNGVAAAHQRGVLHCDLKPSNIMIGDRGEVWVLDWGVARETDDKTPIALEGTPAFMAPELLSGQKSVPDQCSEVYALGTILYCILTWREAPVDITLSPENVQKYVISGKLLPLVKPAGSRKLPEELIAICRKALSRDPSRRYADVAALLTDLHNYQDGFPVSAYSRYVPYRVWKFIRRHPLIPLALSAAALTFGLFHFSEMLIQKTEDKSLRRQAEYNAALADRIVAQTRRDYKNLTSPDSGTETLEMVRGEHKLETGINLSMLEIFASLDALNGASRPAAKAFMRHRGAGILKNLFRLQMYSGATDAPGETLEKIRVRWGDLLDTGCEHDPELKKTVSMIDRNCGELYISCRNPELWKNCSWTAPDGKVTEMEIQKSTRMELPPGDNFFTFQGKNGTVTTAYFRNIPGNTLRLHLPETLPPPGFVTIADDHWFAAVPESDPVFKQLPGYTISASEMQEINSRRASFNSTVCVADAEKHCRAMSIVLQRKVRLPSELELRKSLVCHHGNTTGSSFYGAELPSGSIPLFVRGNDGRIRIFDPAKNSSRALRAGDTAAYRVVIE